MASVVVLSFLLPLSYCTDDSSARESRIGESALNDPVAGECVLPPDPEVLVDQDGLVLKVWSFALQDVHLRHVLPDDPGFLEYRAAVREAGANIRQPIADAPVVRTEEEAGIWRNEEFNNALAFNGDVGSIDPIVCLDALLFAEQNSRVRQLDRPTEFVASVLRRDVGERTDLIIVFGAGSDMFPPPSVHGLEVVDEYLTQGWSYWYLLHNHTLQRNGDRLALGVPVPSTNDVQLLRNLATSRGLADVRVTNGFYSFAASVADLARFRGS